VLVVFVVFHFNKHSNFHASTLFSITL
jgi:hypothetical protein